MTAGRGPLDEDWLSVPTLSRFYGITIGKFYNDHNLQHFHAEYGGQEALIDIATGAVLAGQVTPAGAGERVLRPTR